MWHAMQFKSQELKLYHCLLLCVKFSSGMQTFCAQINLPSPCKTFTTKLFFFFKYAVQHFHYILSVLCIHYSTGVQAFYT